VNVFNRVNVAPLADMKSIRSAIPGPWIQVQYPGQELRGALLRKRLASVPRLRPQENLPDLVYQASRNCLCHGGYLCHSRWSAIRL
jgi:hypothetical protein